MKKVLVSILAIISISAFAGNIGTVVTEVKVKDIKTSNIASNGKASAEVIYSLENLDRDGIGGHKRAALSFCPRKNLSEILLKESLETEAALNRALESGNSVEVNIQAFFNDDESTELFCIY